MGLHSKFNQNKKTPRAAFFLGGRWLQGGGGVFGVVSFFMDCFFETIYPLFSGFGDKLQKAWFFEPET